jgi:hypothetical protein
MTRAAGAYLAVVTSLPLRATRDSLVAGAQLSVVSERLLATHQHGRPLAAVPPMPRPLIAAELTHRR